MRVTPARATALTADAFAPLMAPFGAFEKHPTLAVAVSGGRDSLALALLAGEWARARGGQAVGLIVDHGLRAESADEARATSALLARREIAAEILVWTGPKPVRGLQAAARDARYRLLFGACRRRGILHLLVAHHADDQAETIAMRAARGSGRDGLAGMAALVEWREARLLRPLLAIPRARLTATLQARGVPWIDDPSNADPRFERARLRSGQVAPVGDVSGEGMRRAERERGLARAAVETLDLDGEAALDCAALDGLDRAFGASLLSRIVQAVGGRDHPPRRARLGPAVDRLFRGEIRGKSGKNQDFTLSECRLMLRRAAADRRLRWIVRPENGKGNPRKDRQPLVPAAFFACGGPARPHVD